MKIWTTLTENELNSIAANSLVRLNDLRRDGRAYRLTLRPIDQRDKNGNRPWQRTSVMGRMGYTYRVSGKPMNFRVAAVCWHGHYAFLNALTTADPDARVQSAFYDSQGREDWIRKAEDSRYRNVGSLYRPVNADEVCTCDEL